MTLTLPSSSTAPVTATGRGKGSSVAETRINLSIFSPGTGVDVRGPVAKEVCVQTAACIDCNVGGAEE